MKPIRIACATDTCGNYQVLHADSMLPQHWLCSACEDALTAQMLDNLNRREANRHATNRLRSN